MARFNWRSAWTRLEQIDTALRGGLFEAAGIVGRLIKSREFIADSGGQTAAENRLKDKLPPTMTATMLDNMLKKYPERQMWLEGNLTAMMVASNQDAAKKASDEPRKRETISRSMYEKVLKENEFLKKQVAELKRENRDLQREIGTLRARRGRAAA